MVVVYLITLGALCVVVCEPLSVSDIWYRITTWWQMLGRVKWMLHLPESGPAIICYSYYARDHHHKSHSSPHCPHPIIHEQVEVIFLCNVQESSGHLGHEEMQRSIKHLVREITFLIKGKIFSPDTTPRTGTMRWTCGWWSATLRTSTSPWSSPHTRSVHQFIDMRAFSNLQWELNAPYWVIVKLKALTTINNQNLFNINCVLILQCSECCFLLVSTTIIKC